MKSPEMYWEYIYQIQKLPLPKKQYFVQNIMICGVDPERGLSEARVRLPLEIDAIIGPYEEAEAILRRFLSYYVINSTWAFGGQPQISNAGFVKVPAKSSIGEIPFSEASGNYPHNSEVISQSEKAIERALVTYEQLPVRYSYIQLALDNFLFARVSNRFESRLVNFVIALEALFSGFPKVRHISQQIGNRLDTFSISRAGFSSKELREYIRRVYKKRNSIVHGDNAVRVNQGDVLPLDTITLESIQLLIAINLPKKKLLKLIDNAAIDNTANDNLYELQIDAYDKWKL